MIIHLTTNNMANRTTNPRPAPPKWTEEEDQILIENIGHNPLNLRMCFLATSARIRRSPSACASRWYGTLSKSNRKEHTAVVTLGRHQAVRNRKRFKEGMDTISLSPGFFQRLVDSLYILINGHE